MSPAPTQRNVLGLLGAFVACSVVAGLIAAGLALPAVGASGVAASRSVDYFNDMPGELAQPPLSEKTTVLDKDGKVLARFYEENRESVPLSKISPNMQNAVVAIEDSRFYQHGGFDLKGLARAQAINTLKGGVEQGASTLTQQYVKNVLIESAYVRGDEEGIDKAREQTKSRKIREIRYAVGLEKQLSKQEILNRYLNIAWFGGKIYGVQAAAKYYFNTSAKKLSLRQSAMLAGMIQAPAQWDPVDKPDQAAQRRNVVLRRMLDLKMIDEKAYQETRVKPVKVDVTPAKNGCANAGFSGYFCDYVRRLIISSNDFAALGKTPEDRENTLQRGGLTIKTTIDPKIQKAAWKAVTKAVPPKDPSRVRTAAVTVEPGTGKVLAMAQNTYFDPSVKGYLSTNYSVDKTVGGGNGFQPGSTFKAFTLAAWLKAGKSLNATVDARPTSVPFSAFKSCGSSLGGSATYVFGNAGDGRGSGSMRVSDATANSVNTAFVAMERQLDLCDIAKTAESVGVRKAAPSVDDCRDKSTTRIPNCYPSLTLGVVEVSPLTMAAAYAAFAAEGQYCRPIAINSITDRDGKPVDIPKASCKQTLDQDVARGMNRGLSRVLINGTASRVGPLPDGRPASGKTGTTNRSVATWFVGYTPQRATAVWVGRPSKIGTPTSLNGRVIDGVPRSQVYGATISAPIWKDIMIPAHQGLPIERFTGPSSRLLVAPKGDVPNVAGRSIAEARAILEGAGFVVAVAPDTVPSGQPVGQVAFTSPSAGASLEKGSTVTISVSKGGGDPEGGQNGGNNLIDLLRPND